MVGRLIQLNVHLRTKSMRVILKMSILMTYILNMIKGCSGYHKEYFSIRCRLLKLEVSKKGATMKLLSPQ